MRHGHANPGDADRVRRCWYCIGVFPQRRQRAVTLLGSCSLNNLNYTRTGGRIGPSSPSNWSEGYCHRSDSHPEPCNRRRSRARRITQVAEKSSTVRILAGGDSSKIGTAVDRIAQADFRPPSKRPGCWAASRFGISNQQGVEENAPSSAAVCSGRARFDRPQVFPKEIFRDTRQGTGSHPSSRLSLAR